MDRSSFSISSPDIATTPQIATGAFIYERRSGRFFFFQRNISARKDEDHRYCPVCGNLRKAIAASEAGRLRLCELLSQARLQEFGERGEQQPGAVEPAQRTTYHFIPAVHQPAIAAALTPLAAAVEETWERRGRIRQVRGVFSIIPSRGPPER